MPRRAGKLCGSSQEIITEQLTFLHHKALPDTAQEHQQHYSWWVTFPSVILMSQFNHPARSHRGLVKPRLAHRCWGAQEEAEEWMRLWLWEVAHQEMLV